MGESRARDKQSAIHSKRGEKDRRAEDIEAAALGEKGGPLGGQPI